MICQHLKDAGDPAPVSAYDQGCPQCVEGGFSDWVHLRLCLTCGHVGCCDSSPQRHADRHHRASDHPVMRSFEPHEHWRWCYVDELLG